MGDDLLQQLWENEEEAITSSMGKVLGSDPSPQTLCVPNNSLLNSFERYRHMHELNRLVLDTLP